MTLRPSLALAAMLLLLASPAFAGSGGAADTAPAAAPPSTNSFDALSAGDRKIARALFLAQHPTPSGPAPLSLNQIADLKAGGNWAKVFKQMQTTGLLQAKSLGQVVEGYEHQRRSEDRAGGAGANTRQVLVTNGQGFIVASTRNKGAGALHGGDEVAERGGTALETAIDVPADHGGEGRPDRPERPERGKGR
jgi:hypothetical protein